MKVSGAIKSVIHGVTTNNLINSDSRHWKRNDNVITRPDEGLTKRPPLEHVADIGATLGTGEFVKEFIIHDVSYFLIVRKSPLALSVYREDGTEFTVTDLVDDGYLDTVEEDDLKLAVHGELVFLVNNKTTVLMETSTETFAENSLLYIRSPIEKDSVVKVSAVDNLGDRITKSITVPGTVLGTAPDKIATQISNAFDAEATFNCVSAGAVVQFVRTDGAYSQVTVESEFGTAQDEIVVLNGEVESFDHLPKWSFHNNRQTVKPKNVAEGNAVYMRAVAESYKDEEDALADPTIVWPTALWEDLDFSWYKGNTKLGGNPTDITAYHYLEYRSADETAIYYQGAKVERLVIAYLSPHDEIDMSRVTNYFLLKFDSNPGWYQFQAEYIRTALAATPQVEVSKRILSYEGSYTWFSYDISGASPHVHSTLYDVWFGQAGEYPAVSTTLIQVRWIEHAEPYLDADIDRETMPHVLQPLPGNEFAYQSVDWDDRRAGDEETNPVPKFINNTIEDIAIYQNRLACLTNDEVVMSASGNVFHFFRDTVTQLLDKHPINIRSTSAKSPKLNFFVYHNRDLLITAGRQQYKISGDVSLTPQTASMQATTSYNSSETVEPISVGEHVYLPSHHGEYLNLNRYIGSEQNFTPDSASNITQHARKYITGTVDRLAGMPNHGLLFAASSTGDTIFVCNYDTDVSRTEDTRFAWFKWNDFTSANYEIRAIAATKNKLSVVIDVPTLGLSMLEFDTDAGADKKYLDYQQTHTAVNTTITVGTTYGIPEAQIVAVQGTGCPEPGDYVTITDLTAGVLTLDTDMEGGTVYVGREFNVYAEPNMLTIRDEGGTVNSPANLRLQKFWLRFVNTGVCNATEQSPFDTYDDQEFSGVISNSLDAITDTAVTTEDDFKVGFKQKADVGTLLIHVKSWLPMTISQVDWVGNYTSRGRRF